MTKSISAQGFTLSKDQSDLINRKMERIGYAENLIVDLVLRVKEDKKFYFDTTVSFKWGTKSHVACDDYDFAAGLNKMMDMLDTKIKKEKDKIQER